MTEHIDCQAACDAVPAVGEPRTMRERRSLTPSTVQRANATRREPVSGVPRGEEMVQLADANEWPVIIRDRTAEPIGSMDAYCNQTSQLPEFVEAPSKDAVKMRLRNRLVPRDADLWKASYVEKISALGDFDSGYLATEEICRFSVNLVSAYVKSMRTRSLDNPRYRRFFGSFLQRLQGRGQFPARENLETLTGVSFVLAGCSQMGRTAYVQRLRTLFGPPFRVLRPGAEFPLLWYFPIVVLRWPTCGTPEGLYKQFREKLVSELKDPTDLNPILRKVAGEKAPAALTALCVLLNVGLLVVDGACAGSIRRGMREILSFLSTLQGHTNIPVLFSCSEVFKKVATELESQAATVLKGKALALRPPPPPLPTDERPGIWSNFNLWLWQAGLISPDVRMPRQIPEWTYELTLGRIGWLKRGFRELHDRLAAEPNLLNGGVTKELVVEVFESQLASEAEARDVIKQFEKDPQNVSQRMLARHADHLPDVSDDAFNSTRYLTQSEAANA